MAIVALISPLHGGVERMARHLVLVSMARPSASTPSALNSSMHHPSASRNPSVWANSARNLWRETIAATAKLHMVTITPASIPPKGGHIVDAGGGKQHWEVVAKGNELVLYVLDPNEKPVNVDGSGAKGQVLLAGKTYNVDFKPAGGNTLKASGDFTAA
jgi:hypothetical protein